MGTQIDTVKTGYPVAKRLAKPLGPVLQMALTREDYFRYKAGAIAVRVEDDPDVETTFEAAVTAMLWAGATLRWADCRDQHVIKALQRYGDIEELPYEVCLTETRRWNVNVVADSAEEAIRIARKRWCDTPEEIMDKVFELDGSEIGDVFVRESS